MQDAVLHRGMTRRQLAGLRFFADRDPYRSAMGPVAGEAKRWTRQVLAVARAAIGEELWERFMTWAPTPGFDPSKAAGAVFSDDAFNVHLKYVHLTRHWLTQLTYHRTPSARQELRAGPQGLVHWDLAELFERIRRSVENGGVALRRARPR
jgi:hypothetical protein